MLKENNMNYHQSLIKFFIIFFFLFASALALFLASLYAKFFLSFYSFSEAKRFFIFSLPIRLKAGISSGRDTSRPYRLHRHSCRSIV